MLKAHAKDLLHKTERGAVFTDITSIKQLQKSYNSLLKNTKKYSPEIIVQEQLPGHQVIIGAKKDREFGVVLLFGMGGIFVEVIKEFSLEISPVNKKQAYNMIKDTKAYDILTSKRTNQKSNIKKLVNLIVNLSKLMQHKKVIQEIDLNPVIVNKDGAYVVDPKIIL